MRLQRPVAGFAAAQNLPLDPISVSPLDLDRLARIFPALAPTLALITNVDAFEALFKDGPPRRVHPHKSRRLRAGVDRDMEAMIDTDPEGLLARESRRRVKLWINLFKVPKDEIKARLICNAIPVNELQQRPPQLRLVSPWAVVRMAARHTHHATFDFRHYFYQFVLDILISRYFGVRRRDGSVVVFRRLPMGWSFSMEIACRVIEAIAAAICRGVRACGHAIDIPTFVDGGDVMSGAHGVRLAVVALLLLCRWLNIEINFPKSDFRVSRKAEFIGLLLDDERRAFHLVPKWQLKLEQWYQHRCAAGRGTWTYRDVLLLTGCIIWGYYALRLPFSSLRPLFAVVSWAVSAEKESWDQICDFEPNALIDSYVATVVADTWMPYPEPKRHVFAETDATPWSWGHVITSALRDIRSTCYGFLARELPIHIAEMVGAVITIGHVAALFPHSVLVLGIDNEVTRYVLLKGHSPVDALNELTAEADSICRGADLILVPVRVDTENNLSDSPSRRLRHIQSDIQRTTVADPGLSCHGYLNRGANAHACSRE